MDALDVRELHRDFDPQLLARLYREVLEPAFTASELEGIEPLASRLAAPGEPGSLVAVALGPDGELLGGLVADHDRECRVLLLSYLAVRPEARGRGIGSSLVRDVASNWYDGDEVLLAVAEVHDPRHWPDDAAAEGRLRLFEKLGARVLGAPFVQPALHGDGERVGGFLLLAFHVDRDHPPARGRQGGDPRGAPGPVRQALLRGRGGSRRRPPDPELAVAARPDRGGRRSSS